jgi:hypothetical protein
LPAELYVLIQGFCKSHEGPGVASASALVSRQSVHLVLPTCLRLSALRSALAIGSTAALLSAVPSARRAQTLIMPGTLPTHQTSDELLSSTSDAMANDISGSSISSSSDKSMRHSGVTHSVTDDVASSGNSGISGGSSGVSHSSSQSNPTSTVRMGKMLDEQPRTRSSTHHHVSATGR